LLAQVYVELTGGRQIGLGLVAEASRTIHAFPAAHPATEPRPARPHEPSPKELERHRAFLARIVNPLWERFALAN
jgi:DNA polymerase-3 subunit epsilon